MTTTPIRLRPLVRALALTAASFALLQAPQAAAAEVSVERVWRFEHKLTMPPQKSEIVTYDVLTDTLWVAGTTSVDVLSRISGQQLARIPVGNFGAVNSVAIFEGLAAFAIENTADRTLPGLVVFFNTTTRLQVGAPVTVGSLPDMLTFTPDGARVLVANEGTPNPRSTGADPVGSVSVIDVASRSVTTLPINADIPGYNSLRLFPATGTLPTQPLTYSAHDPEPEYIAVDKTGKFAYVGLQEANGIAVLNLQTLAFERIFNLGLKDFNVVDNEIDPSDRNSAGVADGVVNFVKVPVKGLYQPDTIAAYEHKGRTYLVMANEGDAREDEADERRGDAGSDAAEYVPNNSLLGRLTLSNLDSVKGGPLVKFGAHSFSIRDTSGTILFDSGSTLDREANRLGIYDDTRSDNKGVEPEGVALLQIEGRVLAFIGLERTRKSAFAVYDITDPSDVAYIDMIVSEGDQSVEGLTAFKVGSRYYLATANEVSDTTSLFEVKLSKANSKAR